MRFKVTVIATREYEANPAHYPSGNVQEMLHLDKEQVSDDPLIMIDHADTVWDINVEAVV